MTCTPCVAFGVSPAHATAATRDARSSRASVWQAAAADASAPMFLRAGLLRGRLAARRVRRLGGHLRLARLGLARLARLAGLRARRVRRALAVAAPPRGALGAVPAHRAVGAEGVGHLEDAIARV